MTPIYLRSLSRLLPALLMCASGVGLTSCFNDDDPLSVQYKEWREKNEKYVDDEQLRKDEDGNPYYEKIVPSWAPNTFVLLHWHNDRALTEMNLSPMDNSTTRITYQLLNIEGEEVSNSFSATDSLYISKPSDNIIGMWTALTHMNVGDSVTMVIPATAGYGMATFSNIPPYSTLVYNVKLKAVTAYEIP